MAGSGSGGSGGSGSGGSGGGSSSVYYAERAGHAATADEATHAASADEATTAQSLASDSTDWQKIARKDLEQSITEVWTFVKGLVSTLRSCFNGGATISKAQGDTGKALVVTGGTQTDTMDSSGNASVGGTLNVTGKLNGHEADFTDVTMDNLGTSTDRVTKAWVTDIDAKNIGTENLNVTKEAHFTKLVVDELLSNKGAIIISSANCVAEIVTTSTGYYTVYFSKVDGNGNSVDNSWRVGDLALCLTFKAEGAGTFANVRNRYYWRKVLDVGTQTVSNVSYYYIRLSRSSGEYEGSTVPAAGDNIIQLGYTGSDAAYRQSAVILSAYPTMDAGVTPPSLAFYKGIGSDGNNLFNLTAHRYTFMDAFDNDFYGNFRIFVDDSWQNITTFFATAAGLQAEVTNRTNADQALANGMSRLQLAWNKIALSVFSLVNLANKSSFTQTDTTTEWASEYDGKALVAYETFSSYKPTELVTSFDYSYTTYPYSGGQNIVVYGFINGSSSRSFEVSVAIASDGSATATVVTGGSNIDAEVSTGDKAGHVNVYVRNGGSAITTAHVRISPRWGVITISNITVADTDESNAFKRTGIDVTAGQIDLIADKVTFMNSDGTVSGKVSIDPTKGTLITQDAVLRGNLFLPYTRITQDNWSDYGTYSSSVGTTFNLLGEISDKTAAGLNIQIEYIQTVSSTTNLGHVRLPDLTDKDPESWVGCEVNILNATTTEPMYVRGTLNGSNFGLAKWSNNGWNVSDHNVGINPGCEGKFKLIKTGSGTYKWICSYINMNQ